MLASRRGKGTLTHSGWECKLVQPLWKSEWRNLKKMKTDLLYDLAILLLGIYPEGCKSIYRRENYLSTYLSSVKHLFMYVCIYPLSIHSLSLSLIYPSINLPFVIQPFYH
jgi:hypothetical protein